MGEIKGDIGSYDISNYFKEGELIGIRVSLRLL